MLMEFLRRHPGKTVGVLGGFFFGILYIFVGFLDTLVMVVFLATGFYLGRKYDDRESLTDFLDRILPGKYTKY